MTFISQKIKTNKKYLICFSGPFWSWARVRTTRTARAWRRCTCAWCTRPTSSSARCCFTITPSSVLRIYRVGKKFIRFGPGLKKYFGKKFSQKIYKNSHKWTVHRWTQGRYGEIDFFYPKIPRFVDFQTLLSSNFNSVLLNNEFWPSFCHCRNPASLWYWGSDQS